MNDEHDPADQLSTLDLNQLVALDVLLRVRSVTAAARRLGVTQSAMSHTLRRLRATFEDALLVRTGAGMLPTPRAEALELPLRTALQGLARALSPPETFEPASTDREFRLVAPDLFDALVLPRLLCSLAVEAPSARVTVAPGFDRISRRLETGDLDLAVVPELLGPGAPTIGAPLSSELRQRKLLADRFRAFVREGHPALAGRRLGVKAFAALSHVLVSPSGQGDGVVEPLLADHGLRRHVALRVPQFSSAMAVAAATDLVFVAPGALELRASELGLAQLPLTFRLPSHRVNMVWHPRFEMDAGHAWFRHHLIDATASLRARGAAEA